MVRVYLDNEIIGNYTSYSRTTTTEQIIIAKNLSKCNHTFKVEFVGAVSNVDYKNTKPRMYVGTEKSTTLNLTAVLKGTDLFHVTDEYYSPYYDKDNPKIAPTL